MSGLQGLHEQGEQAEVFASDIENEANSYFQKIYSEQTRLDDVIQMLKLYKSSTEQREQEVFACMVHNLFDEYRFFPKYPDKELNITAVLFGQLIHHQLVRLFSDKVPVERDSGQAGYTCFLAPCEILLLSWYMFLRLANLQSQTLCKLVLMPVMVFLV